MQPRFNLTPDDSLQIQNSTGGTVTVAPNRSISNVTEIDLGVYNAEGVIESASASSQLSVSSTESGSETDLNVTITGDTEMFAAGVSETDGGQSSPFDSYTVTLIADGTPVNSTDERLVGIGYDAGNGLQQQNSTREKIRFTLPRASLNQGFNESSNASFSLQNGTGTVLTRDITDANRGDEFNFTINTSELDSGEYSPSLTLSLDGNPGFNERIISVFEFRDVTIGSDQEGTATVTFNDQTVQNGSISVNVASATFNGSESFNIVVHEVTDTGADGTIQPGEIGQKIGESAEVESGTSTDISVNISKSVAENDSVSQLTETKTVVAMLHTTNTSDGDGIVHTAAITRDG
ncbi:MAG: hypothetical protein J07HQW1_00038, partial [Haloquadratum walsbyi J07HQW1]